MKCCSCIIKIANHLKSASMMFLYPIIKNKIFFSNIILLLVIPSMINAYWINHEQYVTISSIYKYGIKIRDGASVPYIFFIPYTLAYFISAIHLLIKHFYKIHSLFFKIFVYIVLICLFATNVFCLLNFSTMISPSIVMLMVETNGGEATEFLSTYLFGGMSLVSYLIIAITIIYLLLSEKKINPRIKNNKWIFIISIITIYMFIRAKDPIKTYSRLFSCESLTEAELWYLTYPVNTNTLSNSIYSVIILEVSKKEMTEAIHNTLAIKEAISIKDSLNIILIIGESYSKHHSNLYDYKLCTNPRLKAQADSGRLYVFNDVVSSYNLTSFVLRHLFSVNSIMDKEDWVSYPAFPILFKNAGYDVYLWDNQRTFGKADVSDFSIASYLFNPEITHATYTRFNEKTFPYDEELIEDFWKRVQTKEKGNLIIFHLMGQHTMPEKRYPHSKQFDVFTCDSIHRTDLDKRKRTLVANYDNSTIYNDWVIDNVMRHYSDNDAVIIYLSDHGEEIYDFRDHYGRTQELTKTQNLLKYQYEIPFMIWCSDVFIRKRPEVITNIRKNLNMSFMNDNVCQILFGLAGMQTRYYHPERDLISPHFKPYSHRIVQGNTNYERVRWSK